jgi:hypothetical protein
MAGMMNTDSSDRLQDFILWFLENIKVFPELYEAETGNSGQGIVISAE